MSEEPIEAQEGAKPQALDLRAELFSKVESTFVSQLEGNNLLNEQSVKSLVAIFKNDPSSQDILQVLTSLEESTEEEVTDG